MASPVNKLNIASTFPRLTGLLELVGHDAADEVGSSASQGAHQLVQLFLLCINS